MTVSLLILSLLAGISAGLLASFFGVGGGIVLIPFLTEIALLSPKSSVQTSLLSILCLSSFIAYRQVTGGGGLKLVLPLMFSAAVGGVLGVLISQWIDESVFKKLFALVVIGSGIHLLIQKKEKVTGGLKIPLSGIGALSGALSGILGVGGGIVAVPLQLYSGVSLTHATVNSLLMMLGSTSAALLFGIASGIGGPEPVIGILLGVTSIAGMLLAERLREGFPMQSYRRAAGAFFLLAGILLLLRS